MAKQEYDRTKLPKWAQQELTRLERNLEHAKSKLAQGPENSRVFADPYSDTPRPLGDAHIEFRVGPGIGQKFSVRIEGTDLYVMGSDGLAVFPEASNVVRVRHY